MEMLPLTLQAYTKVTEPTRHISMVPTAFLCGCMMIAAQM
jgi:hypothetical protein